LALIPYIRPRNCLQHIKTARKREYDQNRMGYRIRGDGGPDKRVYAITDLRVKYLEEWTGVLEHDFLCLFQSIQIDKTRTNRQK
jgi:hypothetical protein